MKTRITIREVAEAAGVAVGTVSRVLNNHANVDPEIRDRVVRSAQDLGYVPSGRSLVGRGGAQRRGRVGVLLLGMHNSLIHLPVITSALQGVEQQLSASEQSMMFAQAPDASIVPSFLRDGEVDGVIAKVALQGDAPASDTPLFQSLNRFPVVWLFGKPRRFMGDTVGVDDGLAGMIAANYLTERGHTRLAYMNPKGQHKLFTARAMTFIARAQGLGARVTQLVPSQSPNWAWPVHAVTHVEEVAPLVKAWADTPKHERATAIFVPADSIAVQVYRALVEQGFQVGRDVSVISCNNELPLLAGLHPALTTIDVKADTIGRQAVERLEWRLRHPFEDEQIAVRVEPCLMEGASVLDLRGKS